VIFNDEDKIFPEKCIENIFPVTFAGVFEIPHALAY
jgi:hypothetical protein